MDIQDTIHSLFEEQAKRIPYDTAVVCEHQSVTYQQLNERSNQIAHLLIKQGALPEKTVAICMERSIDLLCAMLAILKVGGAYVPLDPLHPEARLLFTLTDNHHPLVITQAKFKEQFHHYSGTLFVMDENEQNISTQSSQNVPPVVTPQALAYVIYTSGSTGHPKGTLVEHRSVVHYCRWFSDYAECKQKHRIDFSSNYIFDMAVTTSIAPLLIGLAIVICTDEVKKEVRSYLKYLNSSHINIIKITPSYFKVLLHDIKNSPIALPDLKTIILGGEELTTADCSAWLNTYPDHTLFNEYGPTEATVAVLQHKLSIDMLSSLGPRVPIGRPAPHMEGFIVNQDNQLVNNGEIGELYLGGACLARGYLNQPELTQKQFVTHWFCTKSNERLYKTGDLCRRLSDGTLEFIGRIDHQVKIRGFRIEPTEIEQCLINHPDIKDVIVLAQKDESDEKLIAYYILKAINTAPSVRQLHEYLSHHLPDYMIPSTFVRVASFPLTSNGKLDRQALPIPRLIANSYYLAPSTPLEKTLATIWLEELGIKLIGVEDHFFELGGHSLSAARIISRINSTLGTELTLRELYEAKTISQLSMIISSEKNTTEKSLMSHTNREKQTNLLPLTDFQLLLWLSDTFEPKAKKLNITAKKRMAGQLNNDALRYAFQAVLKKHEVLLYRILTFRPAQRLQNTLSLEITERDLSSLPEYARESILETSMSELEDKKDWSKNYPLLRARLFHLTEKETELQIAMPHMISDDVSPHIIFSDLSLFYLQYPSQSTLETVTTDRRYRDYQKHEHLSSRDNAIRDRLFWENYLNDAHLFAFPTEYIVKNMAAAGIPYSTYSEIPEKSLHQLQRFCAENCITISDGLCAVLGLALVHCSDFITDETKHIFMNIVKSTRGNPLYDGTVGCFLKLEPLKVGLSKRSHLLELSKQIHQTTMNIAPHQQSSSLMKLACAHTLRQKKSTIKKYLLQTLTFLFAHLYPSPHLDRTTLNLCHRLTTTKKTNYFVININVHQSFIARKKVSQERELFGLKTKQTKQNPIDLLKIDRLLDVCLLRDENQNRPYIVISSNLTPQFRTQLGKEMIRIIETETTHFNHLTSTNNNTPSFQIKKSSLQAPIDKANDQPDYVSQAEWREGNGPGS
jgi:amino acid adenylation domain-containing protein